MKWVDRHLNWVVILGGVGSFLCSCIYDVFSHGFLLPWEWILKIVTFPVLQVYEPISYGRYIWRDPIYLSAVVITWAIPLVACGWVLHRKSQSLWWLLVSWIPYIGWTVPIALKNRRIPSMPMDGGCAGEQTAAGPRTGNIRRNLGSALGGVAVGCAVWGGLASAFFDFVIVVVAPESEIVRHEMGSVWFIGLSATMVVLLVGVVLAGVSMGLLRSCGDSASSRRMLGKVAIGLCSGLMAVNVFASWVAGTLPYMGLTGP